jgi:hypothetical protein
VGVTEEQVVKRDPAFLLAGSGVSTGRAEPAFFVAPNSFVDPTALLTTDG